MTTTFITHASGVREVIDASGYWRLFPAADVMTCGVCDRSWDDSHVSARTPTPSARCPFEYEHQEEEEEDCYVFTVRVRGRSEKSARMALVEILSDDGISFELD